MLKQHLVIGEISKPQGVRGELKVRPITYDLDRFYGLERVYLQIGGEMKPFAIQVNRVDADGVYLTMDGIHDRDAADKLRGQFLYVDREDAVKLPEDAEFICDLIGLIAYDDAGREVGELIDVMQPGSADVYVFRGPMGEVLVPALKSVVLQVDVQAGTMLLSARKMNEVAVFDEH